MPLALLHRIAHHHLPLVLTSDSDIQAIRPLIHAGRVKAAMQVTLDPWGGGPQVGIVVTELTVAGREVLKQFERGGAEELQGRRSRRALVLALLALTPALSRRERE